EQPGIGGDVASGEIGFNFATGEWRKDQSLRDHFGSDF
ncbi:hypothetical protein LCGC14_1417930, partial [marine sediment metagenome]